MYSFRFTSQWNCQIQVVIKKLIKQLYKLQVRIQKSSIISRSLKRLLLNVRNKGRDIQIGNCHNTKYNFDDISINDPINIVIIFHFLNEQFATKNSTNSIQQTNSPHIDFTRWWSSLSLLEFAISVNHVIH